MGLPNREVYETFKKGFCLYCIYKKNKKKGLIIYNIVIGIIIFVIKATIFTIIIFKFVITFVIIIIILLSIDFVVSRTLPGTGNCLCEVSCEVFFVSQS